MTAAALLCLALAVPAPQKSLEPVAEAFQQYLETRQEGGDVPAARAAVELALTGLGGAEDLHPLKSEEELSSALQLLRGTQGKKLRKGKVTEDSIELPGYGPEGLAFAYRVPKSYDPEQSYPLLLVVPGEGDNPRDHLRDRWMDPSLRETAIVVCVGMPERRESWTRVADRGRPGGMSYLLTLERLCAERFATDPERIFLAGFGEGVQAVLATANYRPHRFAGVIGTSGDVQPFAVDNFRNVPTLLVAGGSGASKFQEMIQGLGYDNCTVEASREASEISQWIEGQRRPSSPEALTVLSENPVKEGIDYLQPFPIWVDWLAVEPNDPNSRVEARLDVAQNEVHVECEGIARVTVMLEESMLDLDRPITFVMNGERHERTIRRSLDVLLDTLFRGESDPGRPYVAQASFYLLPDRERELPAQETGPLARDKMTAEAAAERGWIEVKGAWVHRDEAKNQRRGMRLLADQGIWLDRKGQVRMDKGWKLQDLDWIAPEEASFLKEGLWKVGGEWLSLEEAERRRAHIDSMWTLPGPVIRIHTTSDRADAEQARMAMLGSYHHMQRVFGVEPARPLEVVLLRNEQQYDRFAAGDPEGRWIPTHRGSLHTIHSAFFAESWFLKVDRKYRHRGVGVAFWNRSLPHGDSYGYHAARLALGLSYADAIDRSEKAASKGPRADFVEAFEAEKSLPAWLRWGAAVYAERYFPDDRVKEGGDPWWTRQWSLQNLASKGGLRGLDEVFAFELAGRVREDAQRMLVEAGCLVAFLMDGECEPLKQVLAELRTALASGRLQPSHIKNLEEGLREHEAKLRAFSKPRE